MKRSKLLGMALAAVLSMLVIPSAAAASGGVEAETYPVSFRWEEEKPIRFSIPGATPAVCYEAGGGGGESGPTDDLGSIIGMTCKQEGGSSEQQLEMNGCAFEFHPGSSSFDVGPSGCGPITNIPLFCTDGIPAQTGLPATYESATSEGHEAIRVSVSEIDIEVGAFCGGGTSRITFDGTWLVTGLNQNGEPVDISVSEEIKGFFVSGEESEIEADQPHFVPADNLYVNIHGSLNAGEDVTFNFEGIDVTCGGAEFWGGMNEATTSKKFITALSECESNSEPASVEFHKCGLSYKLSNSDPVFGSYKGTIGIFCETEGYVKLSTSGCSDLRIDPQSPSNSEALYTNAASGNEWFVEFGEASASGLSYSYLSGFCTLLGEKHTDGVLSVGAATFAGV